MVIYTDQSRKYCRRCKTQTKEIIGLGEYCSKCGSLNNTIDEFELTNSDHPVFNSLFPPGSGPPI